ncbi:MAG: molybdopterin-guanine dinucleotide biosynthesis protein B [Rhodobacterales bacterium]|nr:MAG: molybdopterin-guanine dinucleotide biosynthesis protein B [Rhodobacterales bacterium]
MRVMGIVGWKNSGKTGLVERLVQALTARGLTVSTIKNAHHSVDVDQPGRDSYRHRQAGAGQVLLASAHRWALMTELRGAPAPDLPMLLAELAPCDIVLVEGFKRENHPKIEAYRAEAGHELLAPGDPTIRAVASDTDLVLDRPVLHLDHTAQIADFVAKEAAPWPT